MLSWILAVLVVTVMDLVGVVIIVVDVVVVVVVVGWTACVCAVSCAWSFVRTAAVT